VVVVDGVVVVVDVVEVDVVGVVGGTSVVPVLSPGSPPWPEPAATWPDPLSPEGAG
jgi:hypothetical protein